MITIFLPFLAPSRSSMQEATMRRTKLPIESVYMIEGFWELTLALPGDNGATSDASDATTFTIMQGKLNIGLGIYAAT